MFRLIVMLVLILFLSGCAAGGELSPGDIWAFDLRISRVSDIYGDSVAVVAAADSLHYTYRFVQYYGTQNYDLQDDPQQAPYYESYVYRFTNPSMVSVVAKTDRYYRFELDSVSTNISEGVWQVQVRALIDSDRYSKWSDAWFFKVSAGAVVVEGVPVRAVDGVMSFE